MIRVIYNLLYERPLERRIVMNDGLNHLRTIIRRTEDSLLVSTDPYEIEKIRIALRKLRVELQQKEWKSERERESLAIN